MQYFLKKDLVIPAGTIFSGAPASIRLDSGHIEHVLGLTKDTSGRLIYGLDDDPGLDEWFERLQP